MQNRLQSSNIDIKAQKMAKTLYFNDSICTNAYTMGAKDNKNSTSHLQYNVQADLTQITRPRSAVNTAVNLLTSKQYI